MAFGTDSFLYLVCKQGTKDVIHSGFLTVFPVEAYKCRQYIMVQPES